MTAIFQSLPTLEQAIHLSSIVTPDPARLERECAARPALDALLSGVTSRRKRNKISRTFWRAHEAGLVGRADAEERV